jgi:hypothetical protein
MEPLYTTSVNLPSELDCSRLLKMPPGEFQAVFGHNALVAAFISVDNDGNFQHMFKPLLTDKVKEDGSTAKDGAKVMSSSMQWTL